jgi:signal transduction histidine kinase
MSVSDLDRGFDLARAQQRWRAIEIGEPLTLRARHRRRDGQVFPVELRIARLDDGGERLFMALARDVTEQVAREEALAASQRALRTLVATNEALLHAKDERALFQDVCRVVVEQGGFRMAWAGVAEAGEERPIRPVTWFGHEDGYLTSARITWADVPRGQGTAGRAMRTGRVAVVNDIAVDPTFAPQREAALARGYASNAALPLVYGGERLGVLGVFSGAREAFGPEVIELLQRLADDLAFGLAALRARAESEKIAAELALASELMGLEVSRLDLRTSQLTYSQSSRALRGLDPSAEALPVETTLARIHPDDRGLVAARVAWAHRGVTDEPYPELGRPVRFIGPDGRVLWIDTRSSLLRDEAGQPATMISASIDVSDRLREQEQLRALTARVQSIREEEKTRLARDLHDGLGQVLTAMQLELRRAEEQVEALETGEVAGAILDRLVAASELAGETVAAVQRLSLDLRSEALERLGLDAALRQELRLFERRTGLAVDEALDQPGSLDPALATAAFRIAQEALTNVARHAVASRVEVRLRAEPDAVRLDVADDGRGLPPGAPTATHLGLLGMMERAREHGGEVTLAGRPDGGTLVSARLPRTHRSG